MGEDFTRLFSDYQRAPSKQGEDEKKRQFTSTLEDVAEVLSPFGDRGEVFKTQANFQRKKALDGKFSDVSLLLRHIYSQDPEVKPTTQLEIQSDILRQAFRDIAKESSSVSVYHNPIVIREPYWELYYCRDLIADAIKKESREEVRKELELLKIFEKIYMATTIDKINVFKENRTITFKYLWSLFCPGTLVVLQNTVASASPILWCVLIKRFKLEEEGKTQDWAITVIHTGFDGISFGNTQKEFVFPEFDGPREILSLPVYPLDHHPDAQNLREGFRKRGEIYQELCQGDAKKKTRIGHGSHRSHSGPLWKAGDNEVVAARRYYDIPSLEVDGRIVIDPVGIFTEKPQFRETLLSEAAKSNDDSSSDDGYYKRRARERRAAKLVELEPAVEDKKLTPEQLLTTPPLIPCYSLKAKLWGLVNVGDVRDIEWKEDMHHKVQMDQEQKQVVRGLVEGHQATSTTFDDFIPGKGRGLVFLLHGPPGCGKTMTVESVAESLHRPLYYISGGELGKTISNIEGNLQLIFLRIARWEAVLLFDEADTFMAKRTEDAVDRNNMTSSKHLPSQLSYL